MVQSKFIKVDKDVLLEYIYDDTNLISEDYKILHNLQDSSYQYIANNTSGTKNIQDNQLFLLDIVNNKWGKVDTDTYNFLQIQDYAAGAPVRHDKIKFHFPINYTFGEHIGMQVKVYAFDYNNENTYELSNYYFDIKDVDTFNDLGFSAPPLMFQEKLWGKFIELAIPSAYTISLQRISGVTTANSINYNLTNGVGLSQTSPIFIEFRFIEAKQTINSITTYVTNTPKNISVPIIPEFETLAVTIEESTQGDFFEIYGTFNGNIAEFKKFIDDSFLAGKRYYVEYVITIFEENIKGKTKVYKVIDNFNQKIEERPIIKFSTTTAVIEVEMRIIDQVDNSQILRTAAYGMLANQLSKYSANLSRINILATKTPKIYNIKNIINGDIDPSLLASLKNGNGVQLQQVRVPYPIMIDKSNVVAKSDNVTVNKTIYYGIGKLQLLIMPFDNIVSITIASNIENNKITPMDLSSVAEIKLVFQNIQLSVECLIYNEHGEVDLSQGLLVFKIFKKQIADIRRIFDSTINTFYITTTFDNNTSVIYSGTFLMFDSNSNVNNLNNQSANQPSTDDTSTATLDPSQLQETAIVTRRVITNTSVAPNNGVTLSGSTGVSVAPDPNGARRSG